VNNYTLISLAYARELVRNGRYQDAESVAKSVLDPSVNPGSKDAIRFLSDLEQPDVFNKTITPKFAAQRDEVEKLLREAEGYAQSGRNKLAIQRYDDVLLIDPYNKAAREGEEAINNTEMKYSDEAYNETRSQLLWQVEKSWERPPHRSNGGRSTESVGRQQDIAGTDQIVAKLNSIMIPKVDLDDSPISEAVEYLKQKSVEQDPAKKGVNIFLKLNVSGAADSSGTTPNPTNPGLPTVNGLPGSGPATADAGTTTEPHVTLSLSHVPLFVALDYMAKLSNLKLKIDPYAVSIVPLSEPTDILITKEYQVPPTFIPPKPIDTNSTLPQVGGGGDTNNLPRIPSRYNAQEFLSSQGVDFPTGASANYLPAGSKLVVRNTRDNIDQIDALVDASQGVAPSQVDISTKFIEITQNNLQELGFDWLLGPFNIGGGVYGSGGGGSNVGTDYPFSTTGMNTVGGLRFGDQQIAQNSVDALLAGGAAVTGNQTSNGNPAPGVFSIGGIFTDPQFQLVIRALNQKKGVDLLSAPKVTTKSGVKAKVKITDEFIYPRQYDPPVVPQNTGNNTTVTVGGAGAANVTANQNNYQITPSFPRDFTEQDLGVVLEAKPTIGPDGYTIDLELDPRVVDFDGFINYGSPINTIGYTRRVQTAGTIETPVVQTLTTNTINQPVFSVREVNTFVTVWDGETVALGGLITENIQKAQDKIPFLGDIPWAGRLFRSDADQKIKDNLIIFVTPKILDAEGQPRRGDTEDDDVVKPIGLPQDIPPPSFDSADVGSK
jgi:general secretion pathway protein D